MAGSCDPSVGCDAGGPSPWSAELAGEGALPKAPTDLRASSRAPAPAPRASRLPESLRLGGRVCLQGSLWGLWTGGAPCSVVGLGAVRGSAAGEGVLTPGVGQPVATVGAPAPICRSRVALQRSPGRASGCHLAGEDLLPATACQGCARRGAQQRPSPEVVQSLSYEVRV